MRIYVDSLDPNEIKKSIELGYVYGVTSNPFLLEKHISSLDEYIDIIEAIMPIAGEEFHVQVPGINEEEIVQNAIKIHSISPEKIV